MDRVHTETRPALYRLSARIIPYADGVLFQTNPLWERHLRAVMPVFQHTHLASVSRAVAEVVRAHVDRWARAGAVDDLYVAMTRLGAAVALRAMCGIDAESAAGLRLAEALVRYKLTTMENNPARRLDRADATPLDVLKPPWRAPQALLRLYRDGREVDTSLAAIRDHGPGVITALRALAPHHGAFVSWINHLFGAYNAIDYATTAALVLLERNPAIRADLREGSPRTRRSRPARARSRRCRARTRLRARSSAWRPWRTSRYESSARPPRSTAFDS